MNAVFVFMLVLTLPGKPPLVYEEDGLTLGQCMGMELDVLTRPVTGPLLKGAEIDAGCTRKIAPSQEH